MWRMVGRPERSDPDELVFNLFHSSTAPRGFNFVGYKSPEYDRIAEQQRQAVDIEARKKLIREGKPSSAATPLTPFSSTRRPCKPSTSRSGTQARSSSKRASASEIS